jgi:hypothetical protein
MTELFLLTFLGIFVTCALLYAQNAHYKHVNRAKKYEFDNKTLEAHLITSEEVEDLKKRVDTLSLKSGFKL